MTTLRYSSFWVPLDELKMLILLILGTIYILCFFPGMPPREDEVISSSPGYDIASEYLTKSINFSVNPCDDFFEFTCGNWIANHPIPEHRTNYDNFEVLVDRVQEQMRDVFESNETFKSKSITALKSIYKKCMDKDELNRIGAKRLIENVRGFGVWPLLEGDKKWRVRKYNLTSLLIHVSRTRNVHAFIKYSITLDTKNVSRRLIEFDQGDLILGRFSRDYYLDKKHGKKIEALRSSLISKVELMKKDANLSINRRKIENDIDELIDFETKMARILVADENRRNYEKLYNLRRLSDLQKLMPLVDWLQFFLAIAPRASRQYLSSDPEVLIRDFDYLKRITEALNTTNPRIITNYVLLRYSLNWEREMGEKYENVTQEFNKVMYGKQQKALPWQDCTSHTVEQLEQLQYATSAIYIRKIFDRESKKVTLEMINDLQEAFREILSNSDWMDHRTKAIALDKAKQMLPLIAYPDFVLNDKKLDMYYGGLNVHDNDSYSKMLEKVARWGIKDSFKRLTKPVDRSEYDYNSAIVNAYNSRTSNSIKFPAAILQAPFFHHTFPRALNYGGIGAIIGHEITHGFDDEGRQFDANGSLREWWNRRVKRKFEKRAQCITNQYGNITVPGTGLKINGKLTLSENIADIGGVKQAYRAYKAYLKKHGEEERIRGMEEYNNKQMFFLGYASMWCGHFTHDELIRRVLIDPHAPLRYRVNQVLANQPEFAAAFKCKEGSAMNPTKRCGVW